MRVSFLAMGSCVNWRIINGIEVSFWHIAALGAFRRSLDV